MCREDITIIDPESPRARPRHPGPAYGPAASGGVRNRRPEPASGSGVRRRPEPAAASGAGDTYLMNEMYTTWGLPWLSQARS